MRDDIDQINKRYKLLSKNIPKFQYDEEREKNVLHEMAEKVAIFKPIAKMAGPISYSLHACGVYVDFFKGPFYALPHLISGTANYLDHHYSCYRNPFPEKMKSSGYYDSSQATALTKEALRNKAKNFFEIYTKVHCQLGYPSNFDYGAFKNVVRDTGLVSSYNSIHPNDRITAKKGDHGEIGGVATAVSLIEGLNENIEDVLSDTAIFCLADQSGKMPFSNAELQKILRELANGIFLHNTFPFFSLHFNTDHVNYAVIHPVYQDTLVGKVISFLDYYMKCFLNGGYFEEEFLQQWHKNQNSDLDFLRKNRKDFNSYVGKLSCDYTSLRQKECFSGLDFDEGKNKNSVNNHAFRTSFRIISEQRSLKRYKNIFIIDPAFSVEHDIELWPEYKEFLERYYKENGKYPDDYLTLLALYEEAARDIHDIMPTLPMFHDYFQMLGVISFFSYYFSTLKEMGKIPSLEKIPLQKNEPVPPVFPPIPVRYYQFHPIKIVLRKVFNQLVNKSKAKFNVWLSEALDKPEMAFPSDLYHSLSEVLKVYIVKQFPLNAEIESDDFIHRSHDALMQSLLKDYVRKLLAEFHQSYSECMTKILEEIKNQLGCEIKLISSRKLREKIVEMKNSFSANITELKEKMNAGKALEGKLIQKISLEGKKLISQEHEKLDQQRKKIINKITQEIEENKKNELKKIPHQQHKNQGVIDFLKSCDNEKNKIIINITNETKKLKDKITEEIQEKNVKILLEVKEFYMSSITQMEIQLSDISLIFIDSENNDFLEKKYPYIAGDHNRVVGGCSIRFTSLAVKTIHHPIQMNSTIASVANHAPAETFSEAYYNGQKYAVFKLNIKDKPAYSPFEYSELINRSGSVSDTMSVEDTNAFSELLLNFPDRKLKFNAKARDIGGQTLIHYSVGLFQPDQGNRHLLQKLSQNDFGVYWVADQRGNLPIHIAARNGNVDAVDYIIAQVPNCKDAINQDGYTPLLFAASSGHQRVVECLVNANVNVNLRLPNGLFALYLAIQNQHHETACYLIKKSCNIHFLMENGSNTLHLAIDTQQSNVALALIQAGIDVTHKRRSDGFSALHNAAANGLNDVCEVLVTKMDVNTPLDSGKTALHFATLYSHFETVRCLVEANPAANINAEACDGETPLMVAIRNGDVEIATYLSEHPEIHLQNKQGKPILTLAAQLGLFEIIDSCFIRKNGKTPDQEILYCLLKAGEYRRYRALSEKYKIDHNLIYNNMTSLDVVAWYGHILLMDYLLEKKVSFTLDKKHISLIELAVKANHIGYLRTFSKNHLNIETQKRLLEIAAENGSEECLSFLLKEMEEEKTDPLLLVAALKSGESNIIDLILKHIKNINLPLDDNGNMAIHIVVQMGFIHLVDFLKSRGALFDEKNKHSQDIFYFVLRNKDSKFFKKLLTIIPEEKWPADLGNHVKKANSNACSSVWKEFSKKQGIEKPIKDGKIYLTKILEERKHVLVKALEESDHVTFRKMTEDPYFVNAARYRYQGEELPLLHLIFVKQIEWAIPVMLEQKADILIRDKNGRTIMHRIHDRDQLTWIDKYFGSFKKALLMSETKEGFTFFDVSAYLSQKELMGDLEKNYPADFQNQCGDSLLHSAVRSNNLKLTQNYLNLIKIDSVNHRRQTPLMISATDKNNQLLPLLLSNGANPDILDIEKNSAFHIALLKKNKEAAFQLLITTRCFQQKNRDGNTPLMLATIQGDVTMVKLLVNRVSDTSMVNFQGFNVLHLAALYGHIDLIKLFIKYGYKIDVSQEAAVGYTPLQLAAQQGHLTVFAVLLEAGADPIKKNNQNMSALEYAIFSNQKEMNSFLMELGTFDDIAYEADLFFSAVASDNVDVVSHKLLTGQMINTLQSDNRNALHIASIHHATKVTALLLEQGIQIDLVASDGNTPLHDAAKNNAINIIKQLCELKVNINQPNNEDQTALHLAAMAGHYPAMLQLMKTSTSADITLRDKKGFTAAQLSFIHGHMNIVKFLIVMGDRSLSSKEVVSLSAYVKNKINVYQNDLIYFESCWVKVKLTQKTEFDAMLQMAIYLNEIDVLRLLISKNPSYFNTEKYTLFSLSVKHGNQEMISYLASLGVTINSCLHMAIQKNRLEDVKLLIEAGAELMLPNQEGYPPLNLAVIYSNEEMVSYLLSKGASIESKRICNSTTVLHHAISYKRSLVGMLKILLDSGANINASDTDGWTPLHSAMYYGDDVQVQFLLDNGALIVKNKNGHFPYEVSLSSRQKDQSESYNKAKALIQAIDEQGHNVSKYAWPKGHDILTDPNVRESKTCYNWTPLHVAVHHGDWRMVQALLNNGALMLKDKSGRFPYEVHLWRRYENCPEGHDKAKALIHSYPVACHGYFTRGVSQGERAFAP